MHANGHQRSNLTKCKNACSEENAKCDINDQKSNYNYKLHAAIAIK